MKRDIEQALYEWKNQKSRMPLLMRGARQVGKSYLIENFGKTAFAKTVVVNFELQPELKKCFVTLNPEEIINRLQLMMGVTIEEQNTLLFLDEIQEHPEAIMALRYFLEKKPNIAVIGAGSLLEFALESKNFNMPVGRIQFIHLGPLSFGEFLTAAGHVALRSHLAGVQLSQPPESQLHEKLLELLRIYLILGGMPSALNAYFENRDWQNTQRIQSSLLQTFRSDFGKYAKTSENKYLLRVFDQAPQLVGNRIKYANIDDECQSRDIKNALQLLELAGIIKTVVATSAAGLPLGAQANEKKFKLIFLDVGLMQNVCGLQSVLTVAKDFLQINAGAVAEQFVGQELSAYADPYQPHRLFFWVRDKKNSSAEVDYVTAIDSQRLPIEVKAGKTGKLRSLRLFLEEKQIPFGVRFSQEPLSFYAQILSVPLYMVEQLPRLCRGLIESGLV